MSWPSVTLIICWPSFVVFFIICFHLSKICQPSCFSFFFRFSEIVNVLCSSFFRIFFSLIYVADFSETLFISFFDLSVKVIHSCFNYSNFFLYIIYGIFLWIVFSYSGVLLFILGLKFTEIGTSSLLISNFLYSLCFLHLSVDFVFLFNCWKEMLRCSLPELLICWLF